MLRTNFTACATLLAGLAFPSSPVIAQSAPVAYVYASNLVSPNTSTKHNVYAYVARPDGSLARVSGTPLPVDAGNLWVNGKYLLGMNGSLIDSYLISSTGNLQLVGTIDAAAHATDFCGGIGPLKVDHSGQYVYNAIATGDCEGFSFQTFGISSTTGKLTYKSTSDEIFAGGSELDFLGNNSFAYSPVCTVFDHEEVGYIYGFKRSSTGALSTFSFNNPGPAPQNTSNDYCPTTIATDSTNHLAVLQQEEDFDGTHYGTPVIATYSVSSTGNVTTTSTYKNMPHTRSGSRVMRMDPSGKLLAVGGANGLDIFHYHGANPVTYAKTLLTSTSVQSLYWDRSNHLYALTWSNTGNGKLYVFTVTTTGVSQAPGSPHAIPNPDSLIVRTLN